MESKLHSFTGEAACGRWAIAQNRKFLWGCHFYWICDCLAIMEILDYSGTISMICRWAQELLGYNFTIIHRPAKMMGDVDTLSRHFGQLITSYLSIANILHVTDMWNRPFAYSSKSWEAFSKKRQKPAPLHNSPLPILTTSTITSTSHTNPMSPSPLSSQINLSLPSVLLTSTPLLFHSPTTPCSNTTPTSCDRDIHNIQSHFTHWVSIDDTLGSNHAWLLSTPTFSSIWHHSFMFTSQSSISLFNLIHHHQPSIVHPLSELSSVLTSLSNLSFIDITFIPLLYPSFISWLHQLSSLITTLIQTHPTFCACLIWVNESALHPSTPQDTSSILANRLPQIVCVLLRNRW